MKTLDWDKLKRFVDKWTTPGFKAIMENGYIIEIVAQREEIEEERLNEELKITEAVQKVKEGEIMNKPFAYFARDTGCLRFASLADMAKANSLPDEETAVYLVGEPSVPVSKLRELVNRWSGPYTNQVQVRATIQPINFADELESLIVNAECVK
jgi:hypothetical protein